MKGSLPLVLLLGLSAACGGQGSDAATDHNDNSAQGDDESGNRGDAGTRKGDAGAKAGGGDAGKSTKDASAPSQGADKPSQGSPRDAGTSPGSSSASDGGSTTVTPGGGGDICARWKAARVDLSEGTWGGSADTCMVGDMTEVARANALRLFNFYRTTAGLSEVTTTPENNRLAQGCAALMQANGTITHTPPNTWKCYTDEAAKTAGGSSISSALAVASVDGYMLDPGNPTTIGHRRWVLSNMITEVGFGSAGTGAYAGFSCQYQPPKYKTSGGKPWMAWPPAGQIPLQSMTSKYSGSIDMTGWSIQSDTINLASATVTVSSDGMDMPVTVTQLLAGYGSMYALRFNPMGWTSAAGKTYSVKVGGTSTPIEYDVQIVDCP